jgi:hypothetical protein
VSVAVFELGGALAPEIPELVIGPWTRAAPSIAAFSASAAAPESLWRVDLARDQAASRAALAEGARSVAQTHAVLDDVPRRLDRAIGLALDARSHGAPLDPALPARGPARAPELSSIDAALVAALTGAEASPLPRSDVLPAWSADENDEPTASAQEPGRLASALGRITDLARGRARIETHVEGALVAHSIMTLSGDTELWVAPRLSLTGATMHARSVDVAVRTRHAWTRILTLVVRGVTRLAALGLPAAGVAALPLVWRFLRDVLREIRARSAPPVPAA